MVLVHLLVVQTYAVERSREELDAMEHLGAPPQGFVTLELESRASLTPLQVLGSVNPPTLLLNGKALELKPYEGQTSSHIHGEGMALWLNGEPQSLGGEVGQFFVQLEGRKAAVPELHIIMRTKDGQVLEARSRLNRIFLDAPFKVRRVIPEDERKAKVFEFKVGGLMDVGSTLSITDGEVEVDEKGKALLTLRVPYGKSNLTARITQSNGAKRLLNVPVRLKEIRSTKGEAPFSVRPPPPNTPNQVWTLPYYGVDLEGFTLPGAKVSTGDDQDLANERGEFELFFVPSSYEQQITFEMNSEDKPQSFSKQVFCPRCETRRTFWDTGYQTRNTFYLHAPVGSMAWFAPRNAGVSTTEFFGSGINANALSPIAGLGLGFFLQHNVSMEFLYSLFLFEHQGSSISSRTLTLSNINLIKLDTSYYPNPFLFVGGGLYMLNVNIGSSNFLVNPNGKTTQLGVSIHIGTRVALLPSLEWTMKLTVAPSNGSTVSSDSPAKFHGLVAEPLGLRWNL